MPQLSLLYLQNYILSIHLRLSVLSYDALQKNRFVRSDFSSRPAALSAPGRSLRSWSSPRPISNSQLHTLPCFHLCPIYLVVFKGSYFFRMGYLILRGASRLDAFSVYPFPTWLPGGASGDAAGTPAVSPSRSSRTKDSSSQISCAHAG